MRVEETKKEGKKKGAKGRYDAEAAPPSEAAGDNIAHLVGSLHDRLSALTFEITALRGDLGAKPAKPNKRGASAPPPPRTVPPLSAAPDVLLGTLQSEAMSAAREGGTAAVVLTAFAQAPARDDIETAAAQTTILYLLSDALENQGNVPGESEGEEAPWARAARIAASFGAEPRVLIARLLLTEATRTATQLGTDANLSTGSLYHHLREMTHAGVLQVVSRNRYALTPLGRRALLCLLACAKDGA